jgi:hypothetical protein
VVSAFTSNGLILIPAVAFMIYFLIQFGKKMKKRMENEAADAKVEKELYEHL